MNTKKDTDNTNIEIEDRDIFMEELLGENKGKSNLKIIVVDYDEKDIWW